MGEWWDTFERVAGGAYEDGDGTGGIVAYGRDYLICVESVVCEDDGAMLGVETSVDGGSVVDVHGHKQR